VLQTVRAFSAWESAVELPLDPSGSAATDLLQITNIDGLGPVTASINTAPFGSLDGDSYVGSAVGARNIVLTVKPNPDWATWTYEALRQLLNTYFMPKRMVRLVFESDEVPEVEIFGFVESNEPQIFSKEGEIQISVICPYPYFTSVDPVVMSGVFPADQPEPVNAGTIETGFQLQLDYASGAANNYLQILMVRSGGLVEALRVLSDVDANNYFRMSTVPGNKYAQSVAVSSGLITNLLSILEAGSVWSVLQPGENVMSIGGNGGDMNWTLTYYNRYGGL